MKERIRQIMESKKMTQQEFASYVGMSAAALSSIFNERTRPTINTVEAIKSKMPEISTDWLLFGIGDMTSKPAPHDSPAPATASEQSLFGAGQSAGAQSATAIGNVSPTAPTGRVAIAGIRASEGCNGERLEKNLDKRQRRITEIRVFFDDQTFESFVPRKS